MNAFLVRRLMPIFMFSILIEALELSLLTVMKHSELDLTFISMVKTSGVLLLTTMISFLYLMLPYVLYLLFLTPKMVNSVYDKFITTASYSVYVLFSISEEVIDMILWTENNADMDFNQTDFSTYAQEIYNIISRQYSVAWILSGIIIFSIAYILLTRKYLFNSIPPPKFGRRLFHFVLYIIICGLAYMNVDVEKLEIGAANMNNRMAEEGTYNLLKNIDKQEITPSIKKLKNHLEKQND